MDRYSQQTPPEKTRGCKEIASEAKNKKHWVFDPSNKVWYTPEEFLEKFGRIMNGQEKYLSQIQILDPNEGVKAGFQRMHDLHIKVEDFTAKVNAYYRNKK